ncbi:MAG: hypothetical protein ACI9YH_004725 [Colwellia sp.]|jgi:hypothetical protein
MKKIGTTIGKNGENTIFARKGNILNIQSKTHFFTTGGVSAHRNIYGGIDVWDSTQINSSETRCILIEFEDDGEQSTIFLTDHNISVSQGQIISVGYLKDENKSSRIYPHFVINHSERQYCFLPVDISRLTSTKDNPLPFLLLNTIISYLGSSTTFPLASYTDTPFLLMFFAIFIVLYIISSRLKHILNVDMAYTDAIKKIISNYMSPVVTSSFSPTEVHLDITNFSSSLLGAVTKFSAKVIKYYSAILLIFFIIGYGDYYFNQDSVKIATEKLINDRKLIETVSVPKQIKRYVLAANKSEGNYITSLVSGNHSMNSVYIDKYRNNKFIKFLANSRDDESLLSLFTITKPIGSALFIKQNFTEDQRILLTGDLKGNIVKTKNFYYDFSTLFFGKQAKELSPDEVLLSYLFFKKVTSLFPPLNTKEPKNLKYFVQDLKRFDDMLKYQCTRFIKKRNNYYQLLDEHPEKSSKINDHCIKLVSKSN